MKKTQKDQRIISEEFELSREAAFQFPTLEQIYWDDPNSSRGSISESSYDTYGPFIIDKHRSEGI